MHLCEIRHNRAVWQRQLDQEPLCATSGLSWQRSFCGLLSTHRALGLAHRQYYEVPILMKRRR